MNLLCDLIIGNSKGNQVFAFDTLRWLAGDEEIAGEINTESDVKNQHARSEDVAWFYLTVFAVPIFILGLGGVLVRLRRRA